RSARVPQPRLNAPAPQHVYDAGVAITRPDRPCRRSLRSLHALQPPLRLPSSGSHMSRTPTPSITSSPAVAEPAIRPRARQAAHCDDCAALCCRLKVVLVATDLIPAHLVDPRDGAPSMMRRDASGWCAALDRATHRCTIYARRPAACRRFAMD